MPRPHPLRLRDLFRPTRWAGPRGRLLTVQAAAGGLRAARAALAGRGWWVKNRLPAIKVGRSVRFDREALDRWIERHREQVPRSFGLEGE